jgi:ubiquinone/menaquinone biosynthesis C-methylase UbiE
VQIATAYDSIYSNQSNVWSDQGRTPEFLAYFSSLLAKLSGGCLLEIGCGEGFLLSSVKAKEKFATDLSLRALERARTRTVAQFSIALAERLPFQDNYFDLIASVGVMEHFLDDREALGEIRRVLKPGGHYVTLIHVNATLSEQIALKMSQYVFPKPKPVQLARWVLEKLEVRNGHHTARYPKQPIQNKYTTQSGRNCLQEAGFEVVDTIHTRKYPQVPLFTPFVVIYVGRKS